MSTVLGLLDARPEVRASELAASLGLERDVFKRNVRKLKELGRPRASRRATGPPRGRAFLGR